MEGKVIGAVVILALLASIPALIRLPGYIQSTLPVENDAIVGYGFEITDIENEYEPAPVPNAPPEIEEDITDWMLILVNSEHPIPQDYIPNLSKLDNGLEFDARAIGKLNAMINDAKAQGLAPIVVSAYRPVDRQARLFMDKVVTLMEEGYARELAEAITKTSIAYPGTSEHQLGLAVDIATLHCPYLDERVAEAPEIKWLTAHCAEYGFILRYPKGKEHITGIMYEPWHFRYVGKRAAQEIMQRGITLEEYLMERKGAE